MLHGRLPEDEYCYECFIVQFSPLLSLSIFHFCHLQLVQRLRVNGVKHNSPIRLYGVDKDSFTFINLCLKSKYYHQHPRLKDL
jgi:hypothetical protein